MLEELSAGGLDAFLEADGLDIRGEQGDGCDDRRSNRKTFGDGLSRVTDRVEADHDLFGLALELTGHLGDTGSVVRDRSKGVLGDDHPCGCKHAHPGERDQVERELQVATSERNCDAQRSRDRDDRVDRGLEAGGDARQDRRCRTGSSRLRNLAHGSGLGRREVLGQAARDLSQNQSCNDGKEHLGALVELGLVADVGERDHGGSHDGEDACGQEAPVDRRHRGLVVFRRAHRVHTHDRREHAHSSSDHGEDQPDHGSLRPADCVERSDAEDDRGDQGHLIGLEEVGRHTRTVTDVVTDVVGDGRGVAGIVFGDTRLDLTDEVRADIRRLRKDASTNSKEQREQRPTEAEAHEDRARGVLEGHDDQRRPEQTEANGEHSGDSTGSEGDLQGRGKRSGLGRGSSSNVAAHREAHADEAGKTRHQTAGKERDRPEQPRLDEAQRLATTGRVGSHHCGRSYEHDDADRNRDQRDGFHLTT